MIKIVLKNKKILLKEITIADVEENFFSKATKNKFKLFI